MAFIPFYTDPTKKTLQRVQIGAMAVLLPLALVFGVPAFRDYQNYSAAGKHLVAADEFSHQGKTREALAELEQCVKLYPGFYEAYELMASLQYSSRNRESAIQAYERGLQALPDHGELHYSLAQLLFLEARYPEALEHAQRATDLLPGDGRPGHLVQRCKDAPTQPKSAG